MGITDSHTKLRIILERCRQLGVHTRPMQLGGLWIVPLLRCAAFHIVSKGW